MWFFNKKEYTKPEFCALLRKIGQTKSLCEIPAYRRKQLLDGDDADMAISRGTMLYTDPDGYLFSVDRK